MSYHLEIPDIDEMIARLGSVVFGEPARTLLRDGAETWRDEARGFAPHDQGNLRRDLAFVVDSDPQPEWAKVGTNNVAGRPMEFGTGLLSIAPDSNHRRHFPPPTALQGWALRHGFTDGAGASIWSTAGGQVARIIGLRGGLEPRRFFERAMRSTAARLPSLVAQFIRNVERRWGRQ